MRSLSLRTEQALPDSFDHLRVDREDEVAICVDALVKRNANVFMWGRRGIGKSFLLRLIERELDKADAVLTARVNILGLRSLGQPDSMDAFPAAVLLALCNTTWQRVLGKPYSELRGTLDLREGDLHARGALAKRVETIYSQVMAAQRKSFYEYHNSVGFSAGATGEKSETGSLEQLQPPILPFEFFEYCEELLFGLAEHSKTRIVALCDEANHLPLRAQQQLLDQYIEMFMSRRVQFVFVAGQIDHPLVAPDGFACSLEVKGLSIPDSVQLLTKAAGILGCQVDAPICEQVAERCGGNPRFLLGSLDNAHIEASRKRKKLDGTLFLTSCIDWLHMLELEERELAAFRRRSPNTAAPADQKASLSGR
jgi:hypothetical protein